MSRDERVADSPRCDREPRAAIATDALSVYFRALPSPHQRLDGLERRAPAVEYGGHLRGDWQLQAVARAQRERGARVRTPSATMCMPRRMSASCRPRPSSNPTCRLRLKLACARDDEIAEPAQTRERVTPPAFRARKPRDLGQPAGDERRHRVLTETQPLHDAGRDRDDVLQRAANLDPGDIVARVQPQPAAAELLLDTRRGPLSDEAASTAAGSPRATSAAKLGPDRTTTGRLAAVSSAMTCDIRCSDSTSSPFVALTTTARGGRHGAAVRTTARKPWEGTATIDELRVVERGRAETSRRDAWRATRRRPGSAGSPASRDHLVDERVDCEPTGAQSRPSRARWTASAVPQLPAPGRPCGSCPRSHLPFGAEPKPPKVGAMPEQNQRPRCRRRADHDRPRRASPPGHRRQRQRRRDRSERDVARHPHRDQEQ